MKRLRGHSRVPQIERERSGNPESRRSPSCRGPSSFGAALRFSVPKVRIRTTARCVMYYITHLAKGRRAAPCWIPPAAGAASASSLVRQSGSLRAPRAPLPHDQPSRRVGCAANLIAVGSRPGGFRADPGPHDQGHFIAPWTIDQPSAGWMPPTVAVGSRPRTSGNWMPGRDLRS
jgi:hypothetical protein